MRPDVYVIQTEATYPAFPWLADSHLRAAFHDLFALWGFDPQNPFRGLVAPGGTAVVKPNWVHHHNPIGHNIDSLITHASVLRCLLDFLAEAMQGRGTIVIGDAPLQSCNFPALLEESRLGEVIASVQERYSDLRILAEDWRLTVLEEKPWSQTWRDGSVQVFRDTESPEDIPGYRIVDLGRESFLEEISDYAHLFRVTNYKPSLMLARHRPGKHEYLVRTRVFEADLLLNVPKMKTHIKAGLTGAMKNLVGINGHKEFLPHHIRGAYFDGGDNYCMPNPLRERYEELYDRYWENANELSPLQRKAFSLQMNLLWKLARVTTREGTSAGSWAGNETIWRTTLDLNHILYFSRDSARHILTILDGIIAGDAEGPLTPSPRPTGVLIGGENPAYVDAVMGRLMGYNLARVPTVYHAINHRRSRFAGPLIDEFAATYLRMGGEPRRLQLEELPTFPFDKPRYWRRAEGRRRQENPADISRCQGGLDTATWRSQGKR